MNFGSCCKTLSIAAEQVFPLLGRNLKTQLYFDGLAHSPHNSVTKTEGFEGNGFSFLWLEKIFLLKTELLENDDKGKFI